MYRPTKTHDDKGSAFVINLRTRIRYNHTYYEYNCGFREHIPGLIRTDADRSPVASLGRADESFYLRQLVRETGAGNGAVQREVKQLSDAGLIVRKAGGNLVFYQANRKSPVFAELRGLLLKTVGVRYVLREALASLKNRIQVAFVYGSIAAQRDRADSDIDLMIVGDATFEEVVSTLSNAGKRLRREINPTIYPAREFRSKLESGNHFLTSVLQSKKFFVLGTGMTLAAAKVRPGPARQEQIPRRARLPLGMTARGIQTLRQTRPPKRWPLRRRKPIEMPDITINGYITHYEDAPLTDPWKPRQTIVIQHGFGRNSQFWRRWVPMLAGDYRVIRRDLRGHGGSGDPGPSDPWSFDGLVRDLGAFCDALDLEDVHLLGESTGGMLAVGYAARATPRHGSAGARLRSLTLCATPKTIGPAAQKLFSFGRASWQAALTEMGSEGWARELLSRPGTFPSSDPAQIEWAIKQFGAGRPPRRWPAIAP